MRQRAFIATLAAGGALSLAARAQERMRRVGLMQPLAEDDPEGQPRIAAVREALHEVGWISGKIPSSSWAGWPETLGAGHGSPRSSSPPAPKS